MLTIRRHDILFLARGLAAVLLLALGVGCSDESETTTDFGDNDPSIVVALGDSITFGYGDTNAHSCDSTNGGTIGFCPRLQSLTGKTVINAGVCGAASSDGVRRIAGLLQRWRPGVVLIDYSPNDIVNGSNAAILNLRSMVAAARANNTVPILGTLVPAVGDHGYKEAFILNLNSQILALCAEESLQCADHHAAFVNDPNFAVSPYYLLVSDGLHPNAAGYALMAETWRQPLLSVY